VTNAFVLILLLLLLGYAAVCAYMYFYQEKIIFQPSRELTRTPADLHLEFNDLFLTASDGTKINAWYLPSAGNSDTAFTVLFFHGNAGNMSDCVETLKIFHSLQLNVLIIDYRGYGLSDGEPSEHGSYLDGEAAWAWLQRQGTKPQQIILAGRSLGGGVATELASRYPVRALILESTYTSMPAIAQDVYPFIPAFWLVRHKYNNLKKLQAIHCPILIIHSRDDDYIKIKHGHTLYRALKSDSLKQFAEIRGDHGSGYLQSSSLYTRALNKFISALQSAA